MDDLAFLFADAAAVLRKAPHMAEAWAAVSAVKGPEHLRQAALSQVVAKDKGTSADQAPCLKAALPRSRQAPVARHRAGVPVEVRGQDTTNRQRATTEAVRLSASWSPAARFFKGLQADGPLVKEAYPLHVERIASTTAA